MTTPMISVSELRELATQHHAPRVLDVRTPGEFQSVHIPGSYNVPLDLLPEHAQELAELDEPVVVVCQSGARATKACAALAEAGMPNLRRLEGGIAAWESAGQPVTRIRERWGLERQVRLVAGGIVASTILLSTRFPATKWLAGGVGAGLTFAAVSNTCAMGNVLSRLPYNKTTSPDPLETIAQLRAPRSVDDSVAVAS